MLGMTWEMVVGKDYSALKRLALRAVACGNVLSFARVEP